MLRHREYAQEYWQAKRGIRLAQLRGDYVVAAVLRTFLNLAFKSWQHAHRYNY